MSTLTVRLKKRPDATQDMFEAMRVELLGLRQRWKQLAPGETLELSFTPGK
jgi:hypothetical protein